MNLSIILCVIIGLVSLRAFSDSRLMQKLLFIPYAIRHNKEWHRFFTSAFVHADFTHLFLNLLVLWMFGKNVESYMGYYKGGQGVFYFVALFLFSIPMSSVYTYYRNQNNPGYSALGASGATSAILFSFIVFSPFSNLYLFAVLPIPGLIFGIAYLWYSSYMSKKQIDNIGHDVHFYGAVFGVLYTLVFIPESGPLFIQQLKLFIQQRL